jgi:hypothetical protein
MRTIQPPGPHQHEPGCGCQKRPPLWFILLMVTRHLLSGLRNSLECLTLNVVMRIRARLRNKPPSSCLDCSQHRIVADRNPFDPYRGRDKALLCNLLPPLPKRRFKRRAVCSACSFQEMRNESKTPEWCPLKGK